MIRRPPRSTLFPYNDALPISFSTSCVRRPQQPPPTSWVRSSCGRGLSRSEEHTSELQSRLHLVCRLLLEKKKTLYHCVRMPQTRLITLRSQYDSARVATSQAH